MVSAAGTKIQSPERTFGASPGGWSPAAARGAGTASRISVGSSFGGEGPTTGRFWAAGLYPAKVCVGAPCFCVAATGGDVARAVRLALGSGSGGGVGAGGGNRLGGWGGARG